MEKKLNTTMLDQASEDFQNNIDWMDFSNKYFSPKSGFIPSDPEERTKFIQSPEYRNTQQMKYELRENQEKTFSGKLNIRIPKTLHARLAKEAVVECTSLNQLILAKLSRPL